MIVREYVEVADIVDDYDWKEVFGEGDGGNCGKDTDPCPPQSDIDTTAPLLNDVAEIIALVNGENDGDEWAGVFLLKDGRYCVATGSCDYTGWDCQAGNHLQVAATLDDAVVYGLTPDQQIRLGFKEKVEIDD